MHRRAEELGLARPTFTREKNPQLFQGWADRIAWAMSLRSSGRLTSLKTALDECDRHLGLPASRAPPAPIAWGQGGVGDASAVHPGDPLRSIAEGIAAALAP